MAQQARVLMITPTASGNVMTGDVTSAWFKRNGADAAFFEVECGAAGAPVGTGKIQGRSINERETITFTEYDIPLDRVMGTAAHTAPAATFAISSAETAAFAITPVPDEFRFVYTRSSGGDATSTTLKVLVTLLKNR
jgi:hypothetical protein